MGLPPQHDRSVYKPGTKFELTKDKYVRCHCCGCIALDRDGNVKRAPICWFCIEHGGSVERKCEQHKGKNGNE